MKFHKFTAAGNDFIIIDNRRNIVKSSVSSLAKRLCDRKFSIGADGLILLEKSRKAEFLMRYHNSDGSYAAMCGNGARCIAKFAHIIGAAGKKMVFETGAGLIDAQLFKNSVKVKLYNPKTVVPDIPLKIGSRKLKVSSINTGVPHAVLFVKNLDNCDVVWLGRIIRYHRKFSPAGTNVDFVKIRDNNTILIRTYERGVEDETLACGTGVTAGVLIAVIKGFVRSPVKCITRSKYVFKVSCKVEPPGGITDVYLEGPADPVFAGEARI